MKRVALALLGLTMTAVGALRALQLGDEQQLIDLDEVAEPGSGCEDANECSHGERCLDVRCECDCHDHEVVPLSIPESRRCSRCGLVDQRAHLRGLHGCNHGPDCCEPAPQFEALLAREMRTLIRELEEVLAA